MKASPRRHHRPRSALLALLSASVFFGAITARGDLLQDLDLGAAVLAPDFDPATAAYTATAPASRGGFALHPRIGSAGQTLHVRDAEGRFRRVSPGATLAAGRRHFLALREDGVVAAWGGSNLYGEITVPVAAQSGVVAVAAGYFFSLALKADGSVVVWGQNAGDTSSPLKVPVAAQSGVVAIAGGERHALALRGDGSVVAWGANAAGESTVPVAAQSGVVAIAAGATHSLALKADGSVVAWGGSASPAPAGAQSDVVAIAAHAGYSVALKADGSLVCWGTPPVAGFPAADVGPVVGVGAAASHLATLRADGGVQIWTSNNYPALLTIPDTVRSAAALAVGDTVAAALLPDGRVVVWGASGDSALNVPAAAAGLRLPASARLASPVGESAFELRLAAPGELPLARVPLASPDGTSTTVISAAGNVTTVGSGTALPPATTGAIALSDGLALRADGTVVTWSFATGNSTAPAEFATEPAVAIDSSGSGVDFALGLSGALRARGSGSYDLSTIPTAAQSGVRAFDVSIYHALALRHDGAVVAWGANTSGQATVPAAAQSRVAAVAAGLDHSAALRFDRTLVFWGQGYTDTGAPAYELPLPKPVARIAAGNRLTAVLFTDGELALFGDLTLNGSANLIANQPAAARSGVVDFTLGTAHVTALKTDGTLVSWGTFSGTHTVASPLLRAGPPGDAVVLAATRAAPDPTLGSLRSSGGELSPAFAAGTFDYAQSVGPSVRGVALRVRADEALAEREVSINGGPVQRLAAGSTLASGASFNLGLTRQGRVVAWGSHALVSAALPAGLVDVVSLAAGANHALALRRDGSVVAWSASSPTSAPVVVPAAARYDVVAIAARNDTSAALKRGGVPVFWGSNSTLNNVPLAASSGVAAISIGYYHALALKTDGSVVGWGSSPGATPPASASANVVAIAAGQDFSLALKNDGSVVSWGTSNQGLNVVPSQIGNRAVAIAAADQLAVVLLSDGSVVTWGNTSFYPNAPATALSSGVIAIRAGMLHVSVLKTDGSVVTWGGFANQTNHADIRLTPPSDALLPLRSGPNTVALRSIAADGGPLAATPLVAGRDRNWFLRADGRMDFARINAGTGYATSPAVADLSDNLAVATGAYGEYGIRFDGTIRTLRGATPPGDLTTTTVTSGQVRPRVLRVAVAHYFAVALLEDRTLRFWSSSGTTLPAALAGEFLAIATGDSHIIAIRADGRPVIWGEVSGAVASAPAFAVRAVAAGRDFNLAIKLDGTLAAWGANTAVLGSVPAGSDFVAIAAGDYHAVALRRDGSVVVWGQSASGQTSVPASAQSGVVAISANAGHTLALRADGLVVAWGNAAYSPGHIGFSPGARRDYLLSVTREPASPALAELRSTAGALTPAFAPATLAYAQSAPAGLAALSLSARAVEPGQLQLRVNGRPIERVATGASLAAGNGFVFGISHSGGAILLTSSGPGTIPVAAQSDLVAIAAGYSHILALRADGTTVAWGTATQSVISIPAAAATGVAAIAASNTNSLALRRDGQVVGWGSNSTLATVPSNLGSDNRAIALGHYHALVLKNDGSVVQWGNSPALPAGVSSGVVAIAAGQDYSLALKNDGTLVGWGYKTTMSVLPESARADVVAISAAQLCALAVKRDGTRVVWSHFNSPYSTPPVSSGELLEVVGTDQGGAALLTDGRVSMWGNFSPYYGPATRPIIRPLSAPLALREGANRIELRVTPAPGRPLLDASFSAGMYHNLVVTAAGSVRFGKITEGSPPPNTDLPTTAQSDVIGVFSRDTRHVVLRSDGRVVALTGGFVPQELQPGYVYGASMPPARAVVLALNAQDTLTLRADGTVFAWNTDSFVPPAARTGITAIAGGLGSQFFAVRADGRLVNWSSSGSTMEAPPAAAQTGVRSVVASESHALVLKTDGTLFAWRYNNPAATDAMTAIPAGATDIVAIAATYRHFLALRRDGVVFSWGTETALNTVPAAAQSGIVAITAGYRHALALREDGTFVSWGGASSGGAFITPSSEGLMAEPTRTYSLTVTRALGSPDYGALHTALGGLSPAFEPGVSAYALPATPYRATALHGRPAAPLGSIGITLNENAPLARMPGATVATSDQAVLALRTDGTVQAFGSGPVATVPSAAREEVVGLAAGREHAVVLKRDGSLVAWGSNTQQQTVAPGGNQFVAVAAGDYHTLALTSTGVVIGWGSTLDQKLVAQTGAGVVAIAAGERTSLALRADGSVVAWGKGSPVPQAVPADAQSGVVAIAAGRNHYLALRSDGRVVEWGGAFPPAPPTHGIVAIAASGDDNFALRADGRILNWQSGPSSPPFALTAELVDNVSAFAIGRRLAALLRADGTLRVVSNNGSSLEQANGTVAYAGPFALPLSARLPLSLGDNTVALHLARFDAALPPVSYSISVARQPAPEWRIVTGPARTLTYHHRFGEVAVGSSATQDVELHNPGTADLVLSGYQFLGSGAADFSVGGLTTPLVIPPGGYHAITFTATPSAAGWRFGSFAPALNLPGGELAGFGLNVQGYTHASETDSWRSSHFSAEERADPALEATVWGDQADPDGDGLPNLLEYALSGDPMSAASAPAPILQVSALSPQPSFLVFTYTRPRRPAEAGLVYRVTASDTLAAGSWSSLGVTTTVVASTADTETIEATVPADAPRRFLRLEVEAP